MKSPNRKKARRTDRPTLPELDQTKRSVLNSLASLQSRRSYQHAMDEFIDWYCSEPRLALNRGVSSDIGWNWRRGCSRRPPSKYGSLQFADWPMKPRIPGY
jgi:hypothetical protein